MMWQENTTIGACCRGGPLWVDEYSCNRKTL